MADVAMEVGVGHYIWSTLPEYKKLSPGKYSHIALFDNKDEIKKYVETLGLPITSFIAPSGYYQNQMGPQNPHLVLTPLRRAALTAARTMKAPSSRCCHYRARIQRSHPSMWIEILGLW